MLISDFCSIVDAWKLNWESLESQLFHIKDLKTEQTIFNVGRYEDAHKTEYFQYLCIPLLPFSIRHFFFTFKEDQNKISVIPTKHT